MGSPLLRSPDWDVLITYLDTLCRERGFLTRGGAPNYTRLAQHCGLSPDRLRAWRRREARPSRRLLHTLAACLGQETTPWLQAAGFEEHP